MPTYSPERWILEVVRGLAPGTRHVVQDGENLLGNALTGASGLDLAAQEAADSPRRMAGRQAAITLAGGALVIRDLESPGGTFVNRQRLFVGQSRALQPGDVIQLGAVQIEVKKEAAPRPSPAPVSSSRPSAPAPPPAAPPPARPSAGPLSLPFALAGGGTCRTWDDFLTISAQRWDALRDELTSGRLAAHLRRIGRSDLVPRLDPGTTADDQLDAWLARLPVSRPSAPELDVHPRTLVLRTAQAGGTIRQSVCVTNVGYRRLRSAARVESAGAARLRLAPEFDGRPFTTLDQTELPLEVELPDAPQNGPLGAVVIESNGGNTRVEVRLERPAAAVEPVGTAGDVRTAEEGPAAGSPAAMVFTGILAAILVGAVALALVRSAQWLSGNGRADEPQVVASQPAEPTPSGPARPGAGEADGSTVVVTGASQQDFPRIAVQFEVRRPDGSFLRDATRDEFRVVEDGKELPIREFQAPQTRELVPTTIVLVVDHSGSMQQEERIEGLKAAVDSFLEHLPEGSRVAVVAFSSEVRTLTDFTTDFDRVRRAVHRLAPAGATRFYDAVDEALQLLDREPGRRVVLALTDGQDTASEQADLDGSVAGARRQGLPVYTLGLGTEREIASADLRRLATSTRGQYYPARNAEQLRTIYESIAERIGAGYNLVYESDRRLPDGTLRPVQVFHKGSAQAGETAVFIPGMVVPAAGWAPLFLLLLAGLVGLAALPSYLKPRVNA